MSTQPVTNTKKSIGVAKHTFDNKKLELDAENEWIDHDGSFLNTTTGVFVVRITCLLCTKHQVKISNNRSFSDAFIKGVEGSWLKKDNFRRSTRRLNITERRSNWQKQPFLISWHINVGEPMWNRMVPELLRRLSQSQLPAHCQHVKKNQVPAAAVTVMMIWKTRLTMWLL